MKIIHIKPNKKLVSIYNTNNPPREAIAFIKNRQGFTWSIITMLSLACCCFAFLSCKTAVAESATFTINNNNAVLELTIPSSISLELNPTTGTDFGTVNLPIGVGTNNQYGYVLSMTASSDALTRTSDVVDGGGNTISPTPTINSITSSYSPSSFEASSDTLNTWGYKLSNSTNYLPIPTSTTTLKITGGPSNTADINTGIGDSTLTFIAKVDTTTPAGTYQTTINFTAVTNAISPLLYDTVAAMSKGTQTASDLQQPITEPTSSNPATDTSNSGVYEYNSAVFGAASDASNNYPIYYYRGILDSSFASTDDYGNIGSSGNGGYYPNYVRLGDTCWRIVRTTGSGGVKMIYNGLYSSGTVVNSCANATSDARVGTLSFNSTDNISSKSIISVGYTFNSAYKTTTANTAYDILFGTNSDYSGNGTNSNIKKYIEQTWFKDAIIGISIYENILEKSAGYCNDRSISGIFSDATIISTPYTSATEGVKIYNFNSYIRNFTTSRTVSLTCQRNIVDLYTTSEALNGNRQLTKPVALLTADEAALVGSGRPDASQGSTYNESSYLRSGSGFWLLSPAGRYAAGYAYMIVLQLDGYLNYAYTASVGGVRPVISLIHSTTIFAGSGTATDPWIIAAP